MTEHRPTYHAYSGDYPTSSTTSLAPSPLVQHYVDGTVSRDIVLLLPILHSPATGTEPSRCLHLVHSSDGRLNLCNTQTEQCCPCCGCPVCYTHESECAVSLPDATGLWQEGNRAFLCQTCAALPRHLLYDLYTFRLSLNEQGQVKT